MKKEKRKEEEVWVGASTVHEILEQTTGEKHYYYYHYLYFPINFFQLC